MPAHQLRLLVTLFFAAFLAACGGGQGSAQATADAPMRIEIAPNALLMTAAGQKKLLAAQVFDAAGNTIEGQVEWSSSHPENIAVDASGAVTAMGAGGSSLITARIGAVQSPPLLAVHTQLPAGAVLLTDANIVGEPVETTPGAIASIGNTYLVQLTGVPAPAIGSLLINTEGKLVAGRVQLVQTTGGVHRVTLALTTARDMFPQLNINEVIDLNHAEVLIPAAIQELYDVQRVGNTFTFTPKPGMVGPTAIQAQQKPTSTRGVPVSRIAAAAAPVEGIEFKLGPFICKPVLDGAAGAGSETVALTLPPVFTIALNPRLDVLFTPAHGMERFVLHSEPTASIEAGLKALIAMEGKVTCETELFAFKIPVGGPMALIVGGILPVGAGVELGGKITAVNMGFTVKGTAKTKGDVGLACPAGTGCAIVTEFSALDVSGIPTPDLPTLSDARLEPTLSTYAFIKASIGNPFLKSLRFDAFKVKAGAALKGNFAPQSMQAEDPAYQSDYKLVSELKAGADSGFIGLAGFLGLNAFVETLLEASVDVATTPVGTVSADKAQIDFGDSLNFKVKLDPTKTGFLGLYNVKRIVLMRHKPFLGATEVGSITASSNQTEFAFAFTHPGGVAIRADEFYAFVVTAWLPFDLFALELGQASVASAPGLTSYKLVAPTSYAGAPIQVGVLVERTDANGVRFPVSGAQVRLIDQGDACQSLDRTVGVTDSQGTFTATLTQLVVSDTQDCDHVLLMAYVMVDGVTIYPPDGGQPVVRIMGGPAIFRGNLMLSSQAHCLAFSHLTEVTGDLTLRCGTAVGAAPPALQRVGRVLSVQCNCDLQSLIEVNAMDIGLGSEGALKFPSLETARSIRIYSATKLTQLEMRKLVQVSPGKLEFVNNPNLSTVEIGAARLASLEITSGGVKSLTGFSRGFQLAGTLRIANNTQFSNQTALTFVDAISWALRPDDPIASGNIANNTGP